MICAEDTLPEVFDFSSVTESSNAPTSASKELRKVRIQARQEPVSTFTANRPLGDALEPHQIHTIGGLDSLKRKQNKQHANYTAVEQVQLTLHPEMHQPWVSVRLSRLVHCTIIPRMQFSSKIECITGLALLHDVPSCNSANIIVDEPAFQHRVTQYT